MQGLNIVELGNVSDETRGTLIFGYSDPGGVHYFWNPGSALHLRKTSDVSPVNDDGSAQSRMGT
jgi:hypothetical protein